MTRKRASERSNLLSKRRRTEHVKMTYAERVAETNGPIYRNGRFIQGRNRTRAVPATQVPRGAHRSFKPNFSAGHWPVLIRHKSIARRRAAATARRLRVRLPVAARNFFKGG